MKIKDYCVLCTRFRCLYSSGFHSLIAMVLAVTRKRLCTPPVLIISFATIILKAITGPLSTKCCRIVSFSAGKCSASLLNSHLVEYPVYRALQEQMEWYNKNGNIWGKTSLNFWTIVYILTRKCGAGKVHPLVLDKRLSSSAKGLFLLTGTEKNKQMLKCGVTGWEIIR